MEISEKVIEAETYRSMGLLEESILIYEGILFSERFLEDTTRKQFEATIENMRAELESLRNGEENDVSEEDITVIKNTLSTTDQIPEILNSASAFMELGLYKHALSEYEKLLDNDFVWKSVVQDLAACILKCCCPSVILPAVKEMVASTNSNDRDKSELLFRLGLEMQKRDFKVLAQEFCSAAKEFDPDNERIEKWLDSNRLRQQILSKYDYLISQNKLSPKQLKKALALSKNTRKSIDFILVHYFKIRKADVGKSLAIFYDCPFKSYNENLLTPFELIIDLEKKLLEDSVWVPLSAGEGSIEILIDDPNDLTRIDQIRTVLKHYIVDFKVGIKEDIQKYIQRFFHESEIETTGAQKEGFDEADSIIEIAIDPDEERVKERAETIAHTALNLVMTTLKRDGIEKAFDGLTDLVEIRRVCLK